PPHGEAELSRLATRSNQILLPRRRRRRRPPDPAGGVPMALRYVTRSVGVPALHRASVPRVSTSAGSPPLAYHSGGRPLGRRLAGIILASRKLEYHMDKELGRLFSEERKNTDMYGQKELEEILATIKALAEPARESAEHA
ncbi:unnamed protein product, partial [Urochloa humidicola]